MRTDQEMLGLILETAETLKVEAVAMSGSRTDTKAPKDEFQDYDVVYVVDDLDILTSNLAWLELGGSNCDFRPHAPQISSFLEELHSH